MDIAEVSNGCGPGKASTAPQTHDTATFRDVLGKEYKVSYRSACNVHDAGYTGAAVRDPFEGNKLIDTWNDSQAVVDARFRRELRLSCDAIWPPAPDVIRNCKGDPEPANSAIHNPDVHTASPGEWWKTGTIVRANADDMFSFVTKAGFMFYDARANIDGTWHNERDEVSPHWTIKQDSGGYAGLRHVTAEWTGGAHHETLHGRFEGVLKTYDQESVITGTAIVNEGSVHTESPMTLKFGKNTWKTQLTMHTCGKYGCSDAVMLRDQK